MRFGCLGLAFLFFVLPAWTSAETPAALDWSVWRAMPVFHHGRMMPVDTFARTAVKKIAGRESPTLAPPDGASAETSGVLFPEGKPRKFAAAELLFSWLVEPERWDEVPFLAATHEGMLREVFGLPAVDSRGNHVQYVSPAQVRRALPAIRGRLADAAMKQQHAEMRGLKYEANAIDTRLEELLNSYTLYRSLSFQPGAADDDPTRFHQRLEALVKTWNAISKDLHGLSDQAAVGNSAELVTSAEDSLQKLIDQAQQDKFVLAETEPVVVKLREAARALAQQYGEYSRRSFETPPKEWSESQLQRFRTSLQAIASAMADVARESNEALIALYDRGYTLRLVPALNAAALEQKRDETDEAQPWLSVAAMLKGSETLLEGYPKDGLDRVRTAFAAASKAYCDRTGPQRASQFQETLVEFAVSVRTLGKQLEPLRRELPIQQRDEALLAVTAYPAPDATWAEVHYNQFEPFLWSWVVGALALGCFGLAFSRLRKPMFWLGMAVLLASQGLTVYGFGLRVYITGWAPVTNMFETVMFVALVVSMLGAAFALGPLFVPGLRHAWRLTALPLSPEAGSLSEEQLRLLSPATWRVAGLTLLLPRAAMTWGVVQFLAFTPYGAGKGYTVVSLLPRTATANDLIVWLVGMFLLLVSAWYLPRLILAGLAGLVLIPYTLVREGIAQPLEQVVARKAFAMNGAAIGVLTALLASYAPIFDASIRPLMPVLRDNFWLTIHVLTITASYGAGALAWGLGNLALGFYLFGHYRDPASPTFAAGHGPADPVTSPSLGRRPPEACAALGSYIYKATQVAVLLLAAGTILGGLWADVSWGRFWGWDPKEVWALVSLLIYLAVLHGRYAGWFGNFGLAVGSVVGATSILMAWYGVNFVLNTGMHSYGAGSGGGGYVLAAVLLNWLYILPPALRYSMETSLPANSTEGVPK